MAKLTDKLDTVTQECEQLIPDELVDFSQNRASVADMINEIKVLKLFVQAEKIEKSRIITYTSNIISGIEKIEELEAVAMMIGITEDELDALEEMAGRESTNTELEYYAIMERRLTEMIAAKTALLQSGDAH